ncbi:tryptorubin family RiPP precursor [Streptacidiphilus sp. MAP5-3]|uniref:tryptorubin family RiPP precursor n=1 Tax=unclassified Streptacidiphilus TaxID=2643834 RepID=UPI003512B7ED
MALMACCSSRSGAREHAGAESTSRLCARRSDLDPRQAACVPVRHTPPQADCASPRFHRKGTEMKVLFAVRNAVFAQKSLKANAWYLWY